MLKRIPIPSTSACFTDGALVVFSANSYFSKERKITKPQLFMFPDAYAEEGIKLAEFDGKTNALFQSTSHGAFVGLDNKLLMSGNLRTWKTVLKTVNRDNMFWHLIETDDGTLFVHDYGKPSTGIYQSTDGGENWKRIVGSGEIDKRARHFHNIAYDKYRDLLVVTLGDGNLVKIAISEDHGNTWKSVNTSAYQCLPITVLRDRLVFGMDSAISRGIVTWYSAENKWLSTHFRYIGQERITDILQASDLKKLDNGIFLLSTGGGSLLASSDLKNWSFCALGEGARFESRMISNENNGAVAVSMNNATLLVNCKALYDTLQQVDVKQHRAFLTRIRGLGYVIRRLPWRVNARPRRIFGRSPD